MIPFDDFKPVYRGYALKNKPALVSNDIGQIGIFITENQVGSFELTLDWIKFYE